MIKVLAITISYLFFFPQIINTLSTYMLKLWAADGSLFYWEKQTNKQKENIFKILTLYFFLSCYNG